MLTSPHFEASHSMLSSLNKRVGVYSTLGKGGHTNIKMANRLISFCLCHAEQKNVEKTNILDLLDEKLKAKF